MTDENKQYQDTRQERLIFIDSIRIFLTVLVIVHHLIVSYGGGSGHWYYTNPNELEGHSWSMMTVLWLLNQSFFMGFFFLVSSYFSPGSYDKKGARVFIKDRLIRLGLPLLIYLGLINPVLSYPAWSQQANFKGSFGEFLSLYIQYYRRLDVGVLWFVEGLLIFSFVYVLFRLLTGRMRYVIDRDKNTRTSVSLTNRKVLGLSLLMGVLTFVDRMFFVDNRALDLLGLPNGHMIQYIALLMVGVLAYRHNWFMTLTQSQGKLWTGITIGLIFLLPGILSDAGFFDGSLSPYTSGYSWKWRSLFMFAIWEQLMCVSMIISLLFWFREKFNYQTTFFKTMARNCYAVFIIHTPIITLLTYLFRDIDIEPILKLMMVTPLTIGISFCLGHILRQLPFAKAVL